MALWVFPIHLYALLVPLTLIPAANKNRLFLEEQTFNVDLLFAAAVVLVLGSLFEIIQNHIDRWLVTTESASGDGYSLMDGLFTFFILLGQAMDGLFTFFILLGQALILISLIGQSNIVKTFALICVLAGPILYYRKQLVFLPTSLIGTINTIVVFMIFKDWVIFMQLITVALTIIFFNRLLDTGNQFYHGLTTLAASSGILFLAFVINNASYG